jgi:hypothetical protein
MATLLETAMVCTNPCHASDSAVSPAILFSGLAASAWTQFSLIRAFKRAFNNFLN